MLMMKSSLCGQPFLSNLKFGIFSVNIPLEEVNKEWQTESAPLHCKRIATHYGIYHDLFNGSTFVPIINLKIFYDCQDDYVLPVVRGNKILPGMVSY